jgi:hypothetical protein
VQTDLQHPQQQGQKKEQQAATDSVHDGNNGGQRKTDTVQGKVLWAILVHCLFPKINPDTLKDRKE